ncbi:MAG TPA: hypothetical protein VFI86_10685, partial [Burkholderiales bacterium]|nr:hypothetical protein [Burkholderiales bacterium]
MARKVQRQAQRRARRRAAALEDAHEELARARLEREAQAGVGRLACRRGRAKEESEPAARLGG